MGHPLLGESKQGRLLFGGSISKSKSCGHQHLLFCQELNEHWTFSWCSLFKAQASNHFCLTTTRFLEMDDGKIGGKLSHLAVKTRVLCQQPKNHIRGYAQKIYLQIISIRCLHIIPYNPSIVGDLIGYVLILQPVPTLYIFSHNIFGQVPLPIMIGYILSLILPFNKSFECLYQVISHYHQPLHNTLTTYHVFPIASYTTNQRLYQHYYSSIDIFFNITKLVGGLKPPTSIIFIASQYLYQVIHSDLTVTSLKLC